MMKRVVFVVLFILLPVNFIFAQETDGALPPGAADEILERAALSCSGIDCPDPFGRNNAVRVEYGSGFLFDGTGLSVNLWGVSLEYQRRLFNFYAIGAEIRWSDFWWYSGDGVSKSSDNVPVILNNTFYLYSNRYFALTANADIGAFYDRGRVTDEHFEVTGSFHNYGMVLRTSLGFECRIFWLMSLRLKFNVEDYIYFKYFNSDDINNMVRFSGTVDIGFHF